MTALIASLSSLLGGTAFLLLGNGLLGTLLGVGLADMGQGPAVSSLVMGAYFSGLILGSLRLPALIGRVGHIRAFALLACVFSTAVLAHALMVNAWAWAALRFVEGVAMAGLFMCLESWLNERATRETRGTVLSIYMITLYLAQGLGPLLLMAGDPKSTAPFAVAAMLLSLAVVPITLTRLPSPSLPATKSFGARRLIEVSPSGFLGSFGSGLGLGAFYALGPLFARMAGFTIDQVALFMSSIIIGGLVLQWPLGRLSDRTDRRRILLLATTGVAVCCAVLALLTLAGGAALAGGLTFALFLLVSALFGSLLTLIYPISVALANDRVTSSDMVGVSGGLLFVNSVGSAIGPLIAAGLMEGMGPAGLFVFLSLVGGGLGLATLWRMMAREPALGPDRQPFRVTPSTSPVVGELDPRQDPAREEPRP
ncbi:MFS transporter [Pararhodospirillum photometricum]|uniref:Major facilitator superfamily MFS_1 n=1 Tax=Pararhodospirillum photometricum DSM 122 TaxID=1150469 RepID=H6SLD0_PARPM|nr:MFS transporter [Pararhodospirillum photometricum]CCG08795.1 Major facilitator superfamily MFS_1 [Pararhodospirillum photometricum DSM 122]